MARSDLPRILGRWGSVAVAGDSMVPRFVAGDWLMVHWGGRCRRGQVVVVEREDHPGVFLIKRLIRKEGAGYWVEGDNQSSSTDSRQWGAISRAEIRGTVLFRIRRAR